MTTSDKLILGVIIFLILLFLGACLFVYELRLEIKDLRQGIDNVSVDGSLDQLEMENYIASIEQDLSNVKSENRLRDEKLVLLEESIDPRSYRWSKIKTVRNAIGIVSSRSLTIEERTSIASSVVDAAEEFDLEANLILAVIRQESNFNRKAISIKNAKGLMQVMDATADEVNDWLNMKHYVWQRPKYNIRVGSAYLARMMFRFDDRIEMAVRAYNAGPTYVENINAGIWKNYPEETIEYLERVKEHRKKFIEAGVDW